MSNNPSYDLFKNQFKEVSLAYNELYQSTSKDALDEKTRQLVYLGILTTCGYAPALKVHIKKALEAGATKEQIKEACLLTIPANGLCDFLEILPTLLDELK